MNGGRHRKKPKKLSLQQTEFVDVDLFDETVALDGCFLKWWYPQNTTKWSFLVGKPIVVGYCTTILGNP